MDSNSKLFNDLPDRLIGQIDPENKREGIYID
jgi:hypothetical protein